MFLQLLWVQKEFIPRSGPIFVFIFIMDQWNHSNHTRECQNMSLRACFQTQGWLLPFPFWFRGYIHPFFLVIDWNTSSSAKYLFSFFYLHFLFFHNCAFSKSSFFILELWLEVCFSSIFFIHIFFPFVPLFLPTQIGNGALANKENCLYFLVEIGNWTTSGQIYYILQKTTPFSQKKKVKRTQTFFHLGSNHSLFNNKKKFWPSNSILLFFRCFHFSTHLQVIGTWCFSSKILPTHFLKKQKTLEDLFLSPQFKIFFSPPNFIENKRTREQERRISSL